VENNEVVGTAYIRGLYEPWTGSRTTSRSSCGDDREPRVAAFLLGRLQEAITAPILEVARVSHEVMEKRDYSLRARKTTEDEIGELVDAFNAMLAEIGRRAERLREADQRKDEFLATLAHELRNPLAPIRNALEILRLARDDPVATQKAREMMERQVNQMVRLVDDLLDVSRITTGKLAVRKARSTCARRCATRWRRAARSSSRAGTRSSDFADEPLPVEATHAPRAGVLQPAQQRRQVHRAGGRIELCAAREGGDAWCA
jgi:signal transduction histidine kinase